MTHRLGENPAPVRVLNHIRSLARIRLSKWDSETSITTKLAAIQENFTQQGLPAVTIEWSITQDPKRLHLTYTLEDQRSEDVLKLEDRPNEPPS